MIASYWPDWLIKPGWQDFVSSGLAYPSVAAITCAGLRSFRAYLIPNRCPPFPALFNIDLRFLLAAIRLI